MSFNKICKDIKSLKIQGAANIAKAGIKALRIKSDSKSIRKLISLRPTEPALRNTIKFIKDDPKILGKEALKHFKESRKKIVQYGSKLIKKKFNSIHTLSFRNRYRYFKRSKNKKNPSI